MSISIFQFLPIQDRSLRTCDPSRLLPQEASPRPQSTRFWWIVARDAKSSANTRRNRVSRMLLLAAVAHQKPQETHPKSTSPKPLHFVWASENRSRSRKRSTAAKHEQNQQDDDHKRQQSATDVHDRSPFLRLARVRPWSLRRSRSTKNKKNRRGGIPEGIRPRRLTH
jgi:hypothetical protein